jgi:uncharacterized protein YndB with AHSA1/START domain
MSDRSVTHATFSLERTYAAPPAAVFAAWADPVAKGRWFGSAEGHELDFRVGGREFTAGAHAGTVFGFESLYRDIVPDERIVYASTLSTDDTITTVSITTVQLSPDGDGTRLVLVEQGAFLDGHERPEWRERGTGEWLDRLGTELSAHVRA